MSRLVLLFAAAAAACLAVVVTVDALPNGVGFTPAMGYNTWNDFRCDGITADNVKKVAKKMVDLGLNQIGYEYVNIDDCWAVGRENGTNIIIANTTAFPKGIKDVADYVHGLGLKFGIYTDRGIFTCAGRPGSQGHEEVDARTYAEWGVDYLKEDSCYASVDHPTAFSQYGTMRDALKATGRSIYFSLCGWNSWYAPVGASLGNSWRISDDCNHWPSIYKAIRVNQNLTEYASVGSWNDPDMLVGSNTAAAVFVPENQSRTQFSMWSVMAAPLLIGSNMLGLQGYDLETYTNVEVIAVDQDRLGIQGSVVYDTCPVYPSNLNPNDFPPVDGCQQVWAKPITEAFAFVFVNFDVKDVTVTCDKKCLENAGMKGGPFQARDLWAHKDLGTFQDTFSVKLAGNGTSAMYTFTRS